MAIHDRPTQRTDHTDNGVGPNDFGHQMGTSEKIAALITPKLGALEEL